jgi:hypothetical protein
MVESDHGDGRPSRVGQVDAAVADRVESASAPLLLVRFVEVEAADDAVSTWEPWRDRVAIRVVVGGPLGTTWDVLVGGPAPAPRAVTVCGDQGVVLAVVFAGRKVNADAVIGQLARRADGQDGC